MKTIFLLSVLLIIKLFPGDLVSAVKTGTLNEIKTMISEHPQELNKRDGDGKKLIHYAVERGDTEIVNLLLTAGLDIESQDWNREVPIHYAAKNNDLKMYEFLLSKGANKNTRDYNEKSALHKAAENGQFEMIKHLIDSGVELYSKADNGMTIFHFAAQSGNVNLIKYLISLGMDLNHYNLFGKTALHIAVIYNKPEIVKFLIENKADLNIKSIDGRTAYNEAKIKKLIDIAEVLKSKGADVTPAEVAKYKGEYFGQTPPVNKAELFAPGFISTDDMEFAGSFSPDLEHFIFTASGHYRNLYNNTIVETKIQNDYWTEIKSTHFSGKVFEFEPCFSPDGKKMIYGSRRKISEDDNRPKVRAWICDVENKKFSEPYLAGEVFRDQSIMFPTMSKKGTIYLTVWEPTGSCQIYSSELKNRKYSEPVKLNKNVNFCSYIAHSYIDADENYILFDAQPNSPESFENYIYVSFKDKNGVWGEAIKLPDSVNISSNMMCPSISPDGKYLFFTSGGNIYWISSKVVFDLKK